MRNTLQTDRRPQLRANRSDRGSAVLNPSARRSFTILAVLAILSSGLFAYWNCLTVPFLFDDIPEIVENSRIRHLWPLAPLLASGPRPVVEASLAMNHAISGTSPWSYHLFNVVVHLLCGITLFGLVRRTLGDLVPPGRADRLALLIALAWTVHPLQTQSVTYVIQRAESMMGLCYLLVIYALRRGAEASRPWRWYPAAVLASAIGMGCKGVMITAPVMALLYDRTFLSGSFAAAIRTRWPLYIGLMATWGVFAATGLVEGVLMTESYGPITVGFGAEDVTWWEFVRSQPGVVLHYLRLAIWPSSLCFDYRWPPAAWPGQVIPAAVVIVTLLSVTAWAVWKNNPWGFAGAWFFVILAPSSSIVPIRDLAFEHRMYLSLAAILSVLVVGAALLWDRIAAGRPGGPLNFVGARVAVACAILLALGLRTTLRNRDYRTAETIWRDTVAKRPLNTRARENLATVLTRQGNLTEALAQFAEVARIRPDWPPSHYNLGNALARLGRESEAVSRYEAALRLKPDYSNAHNNLAVALARLGRTDEAIVHYQEALRINPDLVAAHVNLAELQLLRGNRDAASDHCAAALRLEPGNAEAQRLLMELSKP